MAERFVRVDLANGARDFRPVAIEPGVPLVDSSRANDKFVFRWLGGLAAAPEWEDEGVNFFARDDDGGRLEDIECVPVTEEELKGPLKGGLDTLQDRLGRVKPSNSTERGVHRALSESLEALVADETRTDRPNYFFKYRDVLERWRLVWCWGYQRCDQEPAPTVICSDVECNLLFVQRPGESPKCPDCEAAIIAGTRKRKRPKRRLRRLLLPLVALLLVAVVALWWMNRNRLVATPEGWAGSTGTRIEFEITRPGLLSFLGLGGKDVSSQVVAVSADPRIARLDPFGSGAVAGSPGKTVIHFYLGSRTATAEVIILPVETPEKIRIEPALVELGVGTTAHLKLIGEYKDGRTADLTDSADWLPSNDSVVFADGGFVEGLAQGTTTIAARFPVLRPVKPPTEGEPTAGLIEGANGKWSKLDYLDAAANVSVSEIDFQSLELAIEPDPITVSRGSRLAVDAVADDGTRYSVLESSLLDLSVAPPYVAEIHARHIEGKLPGHGLLNATFGGSLVGSTPFDVSVGQPFETLVVPLERLDLAVGEIADLGLAAPGGAAVRMETSDGSVVEVTRSNRLVGHTPGEAQVTVSQGTETRTIAVHVTPADVRAISIDPIRVVTPVDHVSTVRVLGHLAGDRIIELSPHVLTATKTPSPRYADFDDARMELHGQSPTTASEPQRLALRFAGLTASAPVEVIVAPCRLELTPAGPVDLPLGQMMALEPWAIYRGGYRVQAPPDRVEWSRTPAADETPGLELRENKAAALESGVGPMGVWGTYYGRRSNRVTFQTVDQVDVDLRIDIDRTLRLASEPGQAVLLATGPAGDVELVPELAQFESSAAAVLTIDATSGLFRAETPGETTVTVTHAASTKTAEASLIVIDPQTARLVFAPEAIQVAVDEVARLPLFLEGLHNENVERAVMAGPGVSYTLENPDAVDWAPPRLMGLAAAEPFEITAGYQPYLLRPASARVEVVATDGPAVLRVAPGEASLAPVQTLALSVEEQLSGDETWKSVRPDAVAWSVPPELLWTPPTETLRPTITVPSGASGSFRLTAMYGGEEAVVKIGVVAASLDAADKQVEREVVREPEGRYLPVGSQQRYALTLHKGEQQEPAVDVQWPRDFENDYVRWRAPVLTAKRAGYQQWLQARVGGRAVRISTRTIDPFEPPKVAPRRPDQPIAVRILSDQGPAVAFAVGAEFDDFRIEAEYDDGFIRTVTKKATMRTSGPLSEKPVSFSAGHMIGVTPGQTVVDAQFDGVPTEQGLGVTVTSGVQIDDLVLQPAPVDILPGETITMQAVGYLAGKSVGVIGGLGGMQWSSSDETVATSSGPSVTGLSLGQTQVTAQLGDVTSRPAVVNVVASIDQPLVVDQEVIQMHVGESRRIGADLIVSRGATDFSSQVTATSSLPNVVRFDPVTRSLVGVTPGAAAVTFGWGDRLATAMVEVLPGGLVGVAINGEVVIEPSAGVLAPGQALDLRVYLLTTDGRRIDRTESAVLTSSVPNVASIRGNLACAAAPGAAVITASLPEAQAAGQSYVTVVDNTIDELIVEPARADVSVGDQFPLRVFGCSDAGVYPLFPQPDLTLSAAGPNPNAIRIVGANQINAVAVGAAEVQVNWRGSLSRTVPVNVTDSPWTELAIDPIRSTVLPGQGLVYQVTALRGGRRHVVGPEHGLQLSVDNPSAAQVVGGTSVVGVAPGRANVAADLAGHRVEAALDVVSGGGNYTVVDGGGYGYIGRPGYVVEGDPGYVIGGGPGLILPYGQADHLRFVPDTVRIGLSSPGVAVRVLEVRADGSTRDVTNDPALEFTPPHEVATLQRTADGPIFRPLEAGQTRVAARIGTILSQPDLLVQVGDLGLESAQLIVTPQPLELAPREVGAFAIVMVDPGGGQTPYAVDYSMQVAVGQAVVASAPDGRIEGLSEGTTWVTVTASAPGQPYDGLSGLAEVRVGSLSLMIEPTDVSLRVGESTPPYRVVSIGDGGRTTPIDATLSSMDPEILAPGASSDTFVAQSLGGTQVRALYRNREVFANVTVTGDRFLDVQSTLDEGTQDFSVGIEVTASNTEGPLEYRVFEENTPPADVWTPARAEDGQMRVELQSPRIPYQTDRRARYGVVVEARSTSDESVQRYPFTFRLGQIIRRTEGSE